jgi:transposase InsO family protein
MCRAYSIRHSRTHPHSPWMNGRAERMIRTVKSLIRRIMVGDPELEWEQVIPQIQGALNFSVSRITGLSPAEVFLGSQPSLPAGATPANSLPLTSEATDAEVRDYAEAVRARVREQQEQARQAEERYRESLRVQYAEYPVHDGARDRELRQLSAGEFVIVRRQRTS